MCGIAGVLGGGEDAEAQARAMIETIAHRGPDGVRVERVGDAALAHARLSIIDLECGWQPLHAAGSTVIGNGEIYNYLELIEEFGLECATGSDFEPLLHLYAREGEQAFARLRGMYAFCLVGFDGVTWLVRDGFGIKPLYSRPENGALRFASEPRALGDVRTVFAERAEELLALNATIGTSTIFLGVERASRGLALEVEDGRIIDDMDGGWISFNRPRSSSGPDRRGSSPAQRGRGTAEGGGGGGARKNSSLPLAGRVAAPGLEPGEVGWGGVGHTPTLAASQPFPPRKGEGGLIAQLDAVLEDSVRVHQRSDVPYGLFLSGGIDSAAIATLMARLNERPVTAYTCGFDAPGARDERAAAEHVAKALNLDWRETSFGEADFWRILPEVAWALDDPTTDYATLPTWKLAEAAKDTLTVVLTGEGGDELFAGYGRYRRALRPRWLGGRPAEPRIDAPFLKDEGRGALQRWRDAAKPPPSPLGEGGSERSDETGGGVADSPPPWPLRGLSLPLKGREGLTPLQKAQWADIATWLPNDLLLKLDRCLMAHGLEGRTPFLDREVAAFAFPLPDRLKVRGRYGKWILRKWLERHCPAADPWARKQGFTVPVSGWIAPRAADLAPALAVHEGLAQICDADAVRSAFTEDRGAKHRWPLLFYAVWWNIHVAGMERREALTALGVAP